MKKYNNYKDSGIEWIGEIPEHWGLKRLKYLVSLNDETLSEKTDDETLINYIEIGDLKNGIIDSTEYRFEDAPSRARRIVRIGDVIVSTVRTYLKAIAQIADDKDGYVASTGFAVLRPKEINSRFLGYYSHSPFFIDSTIANSVGVTYPAINASNILEFPIQMPTPEEQTAIANYLDRKTTEIDELITDKKRLLELYEEEKTAIINQAVTKGINPDVPMKDSGIEWLGEIPEHWEVKRFKYYFDLITEKVEEDLPKIGLENIESKSGKFIKTDSDFAGQGVRFRPNDILFGKLRPYLAKVWLSNFDGQAVGDFYVFRTKQEVYPEFAKYRILDSSFIEVTNSSTYGSKMPRVSWEFIADLPIAFPKYQEQKALVYHIETECALIDAKTKNTKKLIDLLTEYRTALISEVVTGKIKVTE